MRKTAALTVTGAAALVLTMAGCGDSNDAADGPTNSASTISTTTEATASAAAPSSPATSTTAVEEATTASPTTDPATTPPATTTAPATAATGSSDAGASSSATASSNAGDAAAYQDGTVYPIKQGVSVKVAFSYGKPEGPYTIALQSVEKAPLSDFSKYKLSAQVKASDLYYVTLSYTNTGDTAKKYPGFNAMVSAYDKDGSEGSSLIAGGTVGNCDTNSPAESTPGKTFTQCKIIAMPKNDKIATVGFDADLKNDIEVIWKAS